MTFHPRAILHYVSSCVILCHAVISQVHEAAGGRWEWAQLHPGGRGKLSGRDLLPGGNELGVSILLEQSTGAEGNLLFLGAQWADKRKGTSQITLLMAISIGCACTGDLTKKKGTFVLAPDSSVLSIFQGWRKNLAILSGSEWEAFKATLVVAHGEGRQIHSEWGRHPTAEGMFLFHIIFRCSQPHSGGNCDAEEEEKGAMQTLGQEELCAEGVHPAGVHLLLALVMRAVFSKESQRMSIVLFLRKKR